jgi:predicted acetyltransferase
MQTHGGSVGIMDGLEVIPAAAEDSPILANLLELYAHDFSEFLHLDLEEDGRFGYASLPLYWSEADRHPFLVRLDGKLAGLVLVCKNEAVWDMAEFFIVRGCRRRGIGTEVAHEVWRRFPGMWEIRVMAANVPGQRFWAAAITAFTGEAVQPVAVEKETKLWFVFRFEAVDG